MATIKEILETRRRRAQEELTFSRKQLEQAVSRVDMERAAVDIRQAEIDAIDTWLAANTTASEAK